MPKKPFTQGKTRTREHILADLSLNYVERRVFLAGHSVERTTRDYGIDLVMTTYNECGEVEPGRVVLQVKATDHLAVLRDEKTVSVPIERQDLKLWLRENDPVILVVYDGVKDRAYWLYMQAYFQGKRTVDLFAASRGVSLHVPMSNRLDRRSIRRFRLFRDQVYGQILSQVRHHV